MPFKPLPSCLSPPPSSLRHETYNPLDGPFTAHWLAFTVDHHPCGSLFLGCSGPGGRKEGSWVLCLPRVHGFCHTLPMPPNPAGPTFLPFFYLLDSFLGCCCSSGDAVYSGVPMPVPPARFILRFPFLLETFCPTHNLGLPPAGTLSIQLCL